MPVSAGLQDDALAVRGERPRVAPRLVVIDAALGQETARRGTIPAVCDPAEREAQRSPCRDAAPVECSGTFTAGLLVPFVT